MIRRARGLVDALVVTAGRFGSAPRREKVRLLGQLAECQVEDARTLQALHETLCFLQAYPDDAAVLAGVDRALEGFPARVERLTPARARQLHDSGIAGTTLGYPFGFPMARWLARRFPRDVEIAWEKFTDEEPLQESLALLLHPTEHDAFTDEGGLGWRRWLDVARGERQLTDLEVVLGLFEGTDLDQPTRDWLFESLALPIGWRLRGAKGARTFARLLWARPVFHATLRRRLGRSDFIREVKRPLPSLRTAPRPMAEGLIEAARLAMAVRFRELHAFSYANPADVLVADPGRGLRIALIGILPRSRLPFEGYYAYLVLKNGVPVGYGAAWQLFGTLELAVNVFETFRRGESAFILGQVLRAYHEALRMRIVVIDPYQLGVGNPEALESGAFYFYRRLGFRPGDPAVERLAQAEQEKIARDPSYRTSRSTLERLARSEIRLRLSGGGPDVERRVTASSLATLVTTHIARRFQGDRRAAVRSASATVAAALGAERRNHWPRDERLAFEQLSPLVALIPDLGRWPPVDCRRLVQLLRSKGGPSEARYVRLLDSHERLRRSLEVLANPMRDPARVKSEGWRAPRPARSPARAPCRGAT